MQFVSTRRQAPPLRFSDAILTGLAPDGGLYVPATFPRFDADRIEADRPLPELAAEILAPYFDGDPLQQQLPAICVDAFDFPMPLVALPRRTAVLELFHGPTAAFKDFGARFLAACMARLLPDDGPHGGGPALTILVATSGDTGAAVASAFHRRRPIEVGVLFPKGGVAPRQEKQLTCWDDNVRSFAVRGVFDDCQRIVKHAFGVQGWPPSGSLSSANSINIGRLLPQAMYHAVAALRYRASFDAEAGFVVPSGNIGNAVGAMWAREMGFPIRRIAMASNANRVVPDWFRSGEWRPRSSVRTLANAMDVGDPSNMERVFRLYPDRGRMREVLQSMAVDDDTIRATITQGPDEWGRIWCPHTATAVHYRETLATPDWVVVATAHPAKFDSIVEPLIGKSVPVPEALARLLERPNRSVEIDAEFAALCEGWR